MKNVTKVDLVPWSTTCILADIATYCALHLLIHWCPPSPLAHTSSGTDAIRAKPMHLIQPFNQPFNPGRHRGPCILHSLYKINAMDGAGVCQNSIPI